MEMVEDSSADELLEEVQECLEEIEDLRNE